MKVTEDVLQRAATQGIAEEEALIRWVEEGKTLGKLLAEKRDASGKVIRIRPLFPYPQVAKYKGSGSTDEEKNFRSKDRN